MVKASVADIQLRPATAGDAGFLREVYASSREDELAVTGWPDEQKAEFCRMQSEAQESHYRTYYPGATYSVVERDGVAIGRLYVDRWTREIRVMDIALLPGHRRGGIGTLLLRQLQAEAREVGKILSIHVEKFNPALRLYQDLGFKLEEEKEVYLLLNWRPD